MRIKVTTQDPPWHVNFIMHDVFNEAAIRREAKKIIKKRFYEEVTKRAHGHFNIDWSYDD